MDLGVSVLEVSQIYILSLSSSPPPTQSHACLLYFIYFLVVSYLVVWISDHPPQSSVCCNSKPTSPTSDFPLLFLKQ